MRRKYNYKTVKQLSVTVLSFMVVSVLLDAKGLVAWAERLDPGVIRTLSLPVVTKLDQMTEPLKLSSIRQPIVAFLHDTAPSEPQGAVNQGDATVAQTSPTNITTTAPKQKVSETDFASINVPINTALPAEFAQLNNNTPITIALAGDSMMAVGLSSSIQNHFANDKNLKFVKASKAATGLTRPEIFSWPINYPKMIGQNQPNLVIVAIGANDAQDIDIQGRVIHYGEPEWFAIYEKHMTEYLDIISQNNAKVIWIGLPVMRLQKFNKKLELMNKFTYQVTKNYPNVTWYNPNHIFAGENGEYKEFGTGMDGKNIQIRSGDGIHLTNGGAMLMVPSLFSWYNPPTHSEDTGTSP